MLLSAAITTKTGRGERALRPRARPALSLTPRLCTLNRAALLSRQFVEMGRLRIEGLLAAFPKLVLGEVGKQHTYVETDNVRYVYLPVESLYLLLITNKGSNIIEDLDTLRLLSQLIPEQVGAGVAINEESVASKAFELLFAFDEVIASGGYREDINMHTIVTNLQMESHEEKLALMIKASKMAEAKEASKRKAQELREKARADERAGRGGAPAGSRYGGSGMSSVSSDDYRALSSADPYGRASEPSRGGGGRGESDRLDRGGDRDSGVGSSAAAAKPKTGTGMKLGAKKAAGGLGGAAAGAFAGLIAEEGYRAKDLDLEDGVGGGGSAASAVNAARAAAEAASADQATITIEENVSVTLSRDGGCVSMEVKGSLSLLVNDEAAGRLRVVLARGDDRAFQYQNHPNINKASFANDAVIALKQADRSFPTGSAIGLVRWRYANKDDDGGQVPLMITCWPEEGPSGTMTVNVEYTLQKREVALQDVIITLPL